MIKLHICKNRERERERERERNHLSYSKINIYYLSYPLGSETVMSVEFHHVKIELNRPLFYYMYDSPISALIRRA